MLKLQRVAPKLHVLHLAGYRRPLTMNASWRPFGKFKVGVVDLDWLGSPEITPATVDPALHLTGRLFYPCDEEASRKRSGISWFPEYNYAKGLATFLYFRRRGFLSAIMQRVVQNVGALIGTMPLLDLYPGAALVGLGATHPVVIFSHGLAGNRAIYSIVCSELASQGYIVLAVEHSDGTASACKVAGGKGWQLYGWDGGLGPPERQFAKTRHRVQEVRTAVKVLKALGAGEPLPGLTLSHGADPSQFLSGALDLSCLAAMGHSYGGATVAALVAEDSNFSCGVSFDPWWYPLPPESPALHGWQTTAPLLVMSSHDWALSGMHSKSANSAGSDLENRQEAILEAARARGKNGATAGGGAMVLVVSGSSHNTFADPLALFSERLGWVMKKLGLTARLDPVLGMHLITTAALNFLSTHLPLSPEQRAMQSWEPSKSHSALDRIRERTAADKVPSKNEALTSASDYLLDSALRSASSKAQRAESGGDRGVEPRGPEDVVTAVELLEAALPSADPASGPHPHAPSRPASPGDGADVQQAQHGREQEQASSAAAAGAKRRAAVLAAIGRGYSGAVQAGEVEQYEALLGREHIFKCKVHL